MWQSKGWARGLGLALTALGHFGVVFFPSYAPIGDAIAALGIALGGAGVVNAAMK